MLMLEDVINEKTCMEIACLKAHLPFAISPASPPRTISSLPDGIMDLVDFCHLITAKSPIHQHL